MVADERWRRGLTVSHGHTWPRTLQYRNREASPKGPLPAATVNCAKELKYQQNLQYRMYGAGTYGRWYFIAARPSEETPINPITLAVRLGRRVRCRGRISVSPRSSHKRLAIVSSDDLAQGIEQEVDLGIGTRR